MPWCFANPANENFVSFFIKSRHNLNSFTWKELFLKNNDVWCMNVLLRQLNRIGFKKMLFRTIEMKPNFVF